MYSFRNFINRLFRFIHFSKKNKVLELVNISRQEQIDLIKLVIENIIVQNKILMNKLQKITNQPAQLDSGYIGQHLVSIVTKNQGGGFRGKGLDLSDGSEIKTANFLDSLDAHNQVAPRWNFRANSIEEIEGFLKYPAIYLVSIDNPNNYYRFRIWKTIPQNTTLLKTRYKEWIDKLAIKKLNSRQGINFQLFPPKPNEPDRNAKARHGNGRSNGFEKLKIPLESDASTLILLAKYDLTKHQTIIEYLIEN